MGVPSLEKLGAKMGANSFYYQRVRAERNSENLGALNSLIDDNLKNYFTITMTWRLEAKCSTLLNF